MLYPFISKEHKDKNWHPEEKEREEKYDSREQIKTFRKKKNTLH